MIDENKIQLWSNLGLRAAFGLTCLEIEKKFKELIILTCDVSTSAGLDRFRKQVPKKFIDVGISEQNLIGVAAGLASEGHKVITTTFSPFQTLRCCEQIKVNLAYMKQNVVMVGLASGLILGPLGYTHCSIEDVSVMRSFPNMTVITPCDVVELYQALIASFKIKGPVYIRLTGGKNLKTINSSSYKFKIGLANTIKEGKDVTIFCNGMMVSECISAAERLDLLGISAKVINMHTIKPLNKKQIISLCKDSKIILAVEEHNIIGGIGSAIAEVLSEIENMPKLFVIGVNDYYDKGGEYNFLLKKHSLTNQKIFNFVKKQYAKI